jgi:hypothetical protein
MNRRKGFLVALLAALGVAGGWLYLRVETPAAAPAEVGAAETAPITAPPTSSEAPPTARDASGTAIQSIAPDTAASTDATSDYDAEQDDGTIAFKADANGRLVTNEKARLDLERLYALFNPKEREKKLGEVAATLPPEAVRQLYELMEQYKNYQAAAYQAYPPDREMTTVEQGESQIDGMHGLRVQFFGEQAAKGMFGDEERVQRELYRLMENEKGQSLTVEEKAERAQRIYREQDQIAPQK